MISQLNEKIREGCLPQIIADNESRVARDLDRLADQITACPELKIVLIAGPSSAGKTTFSPPPGSGAASARKGSDRNLDGRFFP